MRSLTRMTVVAGSIGLLAAGAAPASASAAPRATETCDSASQGAFPRSTVLSAGPFHLSGGRQYEHTTLDQLRRLTWYKMPLLLEAGRSATISIDPAFRDRAGWVAGHGGGAAPDRPGIAGTAAVVTLRACPKGHPYHRSRMGGRDVTFWSGGIDATTVPSCVPITVRTDRGTTLRRTIPLGRTCG